MDGATNYRRGNRTGSPVSPKWGKGREAHDLSFEWVPGNPISDADAPEVPIFIDDATIYLENEPDLEPLEEEPRLEVQEIATTEDDIIE